MRILFAMLLVFGLSGCAAFGEKPLALFSKAVEKGKAVEGKTFDAAAKALDEYCERVPVETRLYLRDGVNIRTQRGDITVTCE